MRKGGGEAGEEVRKALFPEACTVCSEHCVFKTLSRGPVKDSAVKDRILMTFWKFREPNIYIFQMTMDTEELRFAVSELYLVNSFQLERSSVPRTGSVSH